MISFQQNLPPRRAKGSPKQLKPLVAICRRSRHNEKTALCCCRMNRLYCHFGKLCCPPRLGAREDFRSIAQNCIEEAREKVSYFTEKGNALHTSLDSTREHVKKKNSIGPHAGSSVLQTTGTASPIPDYPQRRTTLSRFEADCRGTEDADLYVVLGQAARCRDFAGSRSASSVLLTVYREMASLSLDPRKFKTRSNTPRTADTLRVRYPELCKVDS